MDRVKEQLTEAIIGATIEVHRELGPGLLESAYSNCLAYELKSQGIDVQIEKPLPVFYKGVQLDIGYRLDLLVANQVIVEVKAVERFEPVHRAQILTYLRLTRCQIGLLLNFNVPFLRDGIRRVVLNYNESSAPSAPPR